MLSSQRRANHLSPPEIVATPFPTVFPESDSKNLIAPHTEYEFPEICIAEICDAVVAGATNLFIADTSVICHTLYDFPRDYTSEELHWRTHIWPSTHRITWLMNTTPAHTFDRAVCFTDACAFNYAHWLTEVLPRIGLFSAAPAITPEAPLIVNDSLH